MTCAGEDMQDFRQMRVLGVRERLVTLNSLLREALAGKMAAKKSLEGTARGSYMDI